jgi:hypothetical protein
MAKEKADEFYSEKEAARRRDEVIRRMANTPPQHASHRKARSAGVDRKPQQKAVPRRAKLDEKA